MQIIGEPLPGSLLIELQRFVDERGSFCETYNQAKLAELGIHQTFVQDNQSLSIQTGTVRGLHLQLEPYAQGKLVRVLSGAAFDVAVDVRPSSPTYLHHTAVELRGDDDLLFWIPPGFAHGFCTLEPNTSLAYKVTGFYEPTADRSICWHDPRLGIEWPVAPSDAVLSTKDAAAPTLDELEPDLHGPDQGTAS